MTNLSLRTLLDHRLPDLQILTLSSPDGDRAYLLTIAPEIRNMIFEHLVEDVPRHWLFKTRVTFGSMPSIARACKQTYNECMPMFLASTDFIVEDRRHNPRGSRTRNRDDRRMFVKGLCRMGPQLLKNIRSITIECGTFDLGGQERAFDELLRALVQAGVQAHQLKWPGLVSERASDADLDPRQDLVYNTAVMYESMLLPALKANNLLSSQSPVADDIVERNEASTRSGYQQFLEYRFPWLSERSKGAKERKLAEKRQYAKARREAKKQQTAAKQLGG